MPRGRWPAPITRAEFVQLIALLAVLAASAVIAFGKSSQLLTPVPYLWQLPVTLIGCALGVWLARILTRISRDYNDRATNRIASAIFVFLSGFVFYCMTLALADSIYFRNGGTAALGTYPIVRLTRDKHNYHHWALINPFGRVRAMIPISINQYRALVASCGNDCSGAGFCITLPVERAPGGAVRVMVGEDSRPPERRRIARCV